MALSVYGLDFLSCGSQGYIIKMIQLYFECFPEGQKGPHSLICQYFESLLPKDATAVGLIESLDKPIVPQRSTGLDIF